MTAAVRFVHAVLLGLALAPGAAFAAGGGGSAGGAGAQRAINSGLPPGEPGPLGAPNKLRRAVTPAAPPKPALDRAGKPPAAQ